MPRSIVVLMPEEASIEEIEAACGKVIDDWTKENAKLINFIMGRCMQVKPNMNPKLVRQAVIRHIILNW